MPELRTVLVIAPPLLADLIRRALSDRVEKSIRIEVAAPAEASERLLDVDPDVVIAGPLSASSPSVAGPPRARVLSLSADLDLILGPNMDDVAPFTPDALAARLRDILARI